jgi:hypothetical protein
LRVEGLDGQLGDGDVHRGAGHGGNAEEGSSVPYTAAQADGCRLAPEDLSAIKDHILARGADGAPGYRDNAL